MDIHARDPCCAIKLRAGVAPGEAMRPSSPYARYAESLRHAELDETALGRDWLAAGDGVLMTAIPVDLPLGETGYLSPDDPAASLKNRFR